MSQCVRSLLRVSRLRLSSWYPGGQIEQHEILGSAIRCVHAEKRQTVFSVLRTRCLGPGRPVRRHRSESDARGHGGSRAPRSEVVCDRQPAWFHVDFSRSSIVFAKRARSPPNIALDCEPGGFLMSGAVGVARPKAQTAAAPLRGHADCGLSEDRQWVVSPRNRPRTHGWRQCRNLTRAASMAFFECRLLEFRMRFDHRRCPCGRRQ
jgi:hypothetical protein